MFKHSRHKSEIVNLAIQLYPESIFSFLKTYLAVCEEPLTFILDTTD